MSDKELDLAAFDKAYNNQPANRNYLIQYNRPNNYFRIGIIDQRWIDYYFDLGAAFNLCLKYSQVNFTELALNDAIKNTFEYRLETKSLARTAAKVQFINALLAHPKALYNNDFFKAFAIGNDDYLMRNMLTTCLEGNQDSLIHQAGKQLNVQFIKLMLELRHNSDFDLPNFKLAIQNACDNLLSSDDYECIVKAHKATELLEYLSNFYRGFRHDLCVYFKQKITQHLKIEPELAHYMDVKKFGLAKFNSQIYLNNTPKEQIVDAIPVVDHNDISTSPSPSVRSYCKMQ